MSVGDGFDCVLGFVKSGVTAALPSTPVASARGGRVVMGSLVCEGWGSKTMSRGALCVDMSTGPIFLFGA